METGIVVAFAAVALVALVLGTVALLGLRALKKCDSQDVPKVVREITGLAATFQRWVPWSTRSTGGVNERPASVEESSGQEEL